MVHQPAVAAPAAPAKDPKAQDPTWRRRSLLRVRRPAWSPQAKPPAGN
ncbi:MAG TPA: hypothetical protein VMT37_09565 [Solirubrobacterales bacterium]|nr:hypothetical protein [Solirubrobacterales bacterium]